MIKLEAKLTFHKFKCLEREHLTHSAGSSPSEMTWLENSKLNMSLYLTTSGTIQKIHSP